MKVKNAVKGIWPALWYGLKWYFPQYTKPAEVIWGSTKNLRQVNRKRDKLERRIVDIDKATSALADQEADLWSERADLQGILNKRELAYKKLERTG